MEEKRYAIGEKTFVQRTLVLGQWKQLGAILKDVAIPHDTTPVSLVTALGDNLFAAMAVVLTEEGRSPQEKDIPALAAEIEFGITPETAIEVMAHFFELNPIPSLLNDLLGLAAKVREKMTEIGSMNSASSSAAAISPGETGFSGTSPSGTQQDGRGAS